MRFKCTPDSEGQSRALDGELQANSAPQRGKHEKHAMIVSPSGPRLSLNFPLAVAFI